MEAVKTTAEGATKIATKNIKAFGTKAANADLNQLNIQRRKPTPHDLEIEMLYGSNTFVLFYESFSTSYSYTRLGMISNPSGLATALGTGNVQVSISLT